MAAAAPAPAPAGLARLRQEFGQGLAEDVLVSVLEMFQGNVQETINFLRAGQGDYVDDPNAAKTPKLPLNLLSPESSDRSLYFAVLALLLRSGVELNHGIKVRTLTAALGTKNHQLADLLLGYSHMYDLPVIVACLRFLDLP